MSLKKKIIILALFIMLTFSIGYAFMNESTEVKGTANAEGKFDLEFISIGTPTCYGYTKDCTEINLTEIDNAGSTLNIYVNSLKKPGSYVTIPVRIKNIGTIPAKLEGIEEEGLTRDNNIDVTYTNLNELIGKVLNQGDTDIFYITVSWNENSTAATRGTDFSITLKYTQFNN